jgi:hypothetical protein
MSKNGDEYTADVRGVIDDTAFEFNATGNGSRIVVSTGMRKLFHNKYWNPIQDKCPDVLPGDRNRESVPNSKRIQEEENAKYKRAIGDADAKSKRAQEEKDAILKHERDATELAARILREDADAAAKREIAQERERVDIDHVAKKLEMERKASYKQSDRMRRPGKRLLLTDQRAQIVEMWEDKYAFSHGAGDEMVVCTAHADCRDFHCMSMYDALAFDTELGEATEDRRATMAPGCAKGLLLMGVTGAVVLTRWTGLRNELLHYYSRHGNGGGGGGGGHDGLLRTRLPCNVTGVKKLVCSMELDHIESVVRGGLDEPSNLHFISAGLNSTIGDANTREWAAENGYGPLKCEPPMPSALVASLQQPFWNGRDAIAETVIRLARARIEVLVPWDGVLISIKHKSRHTGQSVLNFPRINADAVFTAATPTTPTATTTTTSTAAPTTTTTTCTCPETKA